MKLLTKTKINILLALITMVVLGTTENGIVKAICWVAIFIESCVFVKLFEEMSVANER